MAALTADVVGLIRKTILDSYKYSDGFPILKELVQNANDAEASDINIYFSNGIPNAKHELLRNPALIVYNNGNFTPRNERAIARIADNNKESDKSKIGKFGLGMKSIFHLCDMFFYAVNTSNAKNIDDRVSYKLETINPWETDVDDKHADWTEFSDADKKLFEEALPIDMKNEQGFLLWIPGKTNDKSPDHITQDFVDLTNPFNKGDIYTIVDKLKVTLALLSRVSPSNNTLKNLCIVKKEETIEIHLIEKEGKTYITEKSNRNVPDLTFESFTPKSNKEIIEPLINKEFWINNREKEIDCKLLFIKQPLSDNRKGKLHIQYCVYLPLENPEIEIDLELNADYYILFHGNFSVDSGRTGIQGYFGLLEDADIEKVDDTETAIRYWNKILAQKVLYPNIPAFFETIANSNVLTLNQNDINSILKSMKNYSDYGKVPLLIDNKFTISEKGFALCYKPSNTTIDKIWSLFDVCKDDVSNYIYIPYVDNLLVIDKVFPFIRENTTNYICCNSEISDILPKTYNPNITILETLLSELSYEEKEEIQLINSFILLNKEAIQSSERLQSILIKTIKENLIKLGIDKAYILRDYLTPLFDTINYSTGYDSLYKIYSIGNKDRVTTGFEDSDWISWWNISSKFIIVPGFFDLKNQCTEKALIIGSDTDLIKDSICDFVQDNIAESSKQYFIISGIYSDIKLVINKIISKYPSLYLFELRNMQYEKTEYANSQLIEDLKRDKELFFAIRPNDYTHVLYYYSKLIKSFSVYTISSEVIRRTGVDISGILHTEPEDIMESYASHENFMNFDYDVEFLPKFLEALCSKKPTFKPNESFHVRFLISSFDAELTPDEELYIFDAHCNEVWRKIFDKCRGNVKIISPKFDSYTRDTIIQNEDALKIRILDDAQCIKALRSACIMNEVDFMLDEYFMKSDVLSIILKELNHVTDKDIFYKMPIHINSKTNERQSCTDGCYLNAIGIEFPSDFNNPHILFRLYDNDELAETQKDFFGESKTLTYIESVKILLAHNTSGIDYSRWIFEQIKNSGSRDWSKYLETDEIGLSEWIPLKNNPRKFCDLRSVLAHGIFSSETEEIITSSLAIYTLEDLDISADNKDLLNGRKLLINDQSIELNALVEVLNKLQIDNIPIDNLEGLYQISELLKNNKDFPQFGIVWALLEDKNIKDKGKIFYDFYSKIRGTTSESYKLFINMINNSIIGKKNTIELFNKILGLIIENHEEQFNLCDIKQYPVMGESIWKSPDEITTSQNSSIIPDFRLHKSTYDVLKNLIIESTIDISGTNSTEKVITEDTDPNVIIDIFKPWLEQLKQVKLLYILLFLIKDNYKRAAIQHRNESDFECFTKDYRYYPIPEHNNRMWNAGYNHEEAFEDRFTSSDRKAGAHFHTTITIPLGGEATLHSLSGKLVHAILESKEDVDELFLETPYYNDASNKFFIPLAKISNHVSNIDEKLKNLIQLVLEKGYFQHNIEDIRQVLSTIVQANKYSVKATSIQIMDEIFGLFKQLGLNTEETVKAFTQKERELSRNKATGKLSNSQYAEERELLIVELQELIEKDSAFQRTLHQAVMNKISDNQYDDNSVLFELLQNADDAIKDIIKTNPKTSFEVKVTGNTIKVRHYGREINQSPVGEDSSKYLDDLYNMLTINGSNKNKADNDTGKFGLGFKSVHLVCDKPIIRSGELQFEIIGGMYPKTIADEKLSPGETIIELPLRSNKSAGEIVNEFKKNAILQTVFCKCVSLITIDGFDYSVEETELCNFPTGTVSLISSEDKNYLLFENLKAQLPFSILFKLSDDKKTVVEMKKTDGKKVWNTTPLSDGENLPFALNSNFIPDTGRKHLADNKNDIVLAQIANELAFLLADYLKSDNPIYRDSILDILVSSSNIREKFFNSFAKDILQDLFNTTNGVIANGFGSIMNNKRKLVYIEPTSYGLDADRSSDFMNLVQNYLNIVTENDFYLMSGVAKKCYTDYQLNGIEQISELAELLYRYVPNKKLTNDVLVNYLKIAKKTDRAIFRLNWDNVYLHSATDTWVKASNIIVDNSDDIDDQHLHTEYETVVIDFLKDVLPKDALLNKLSNNQNYTPPNSDDDNIPDEPISEPIKYSVREVYDWWIEEKESGKWEQDVENYYESKKFPSILSSGLRAGAFRYSPEELFELSEGSIPKEWCQLLWIAAAQSMPYNWGNRDASNKIGMQVLESMGVFSDFCEGVNLQDVYNKYLDLTKTDETRIRLFEMLLRIHKYRRNFADYYDLWKNLPNKTNDKIIESFLVSSNDEELSGCGINLAPGNRTFSIGYRLIIQNLALCGFWNTNDIDEEHMRKLFKVFRGLKDYEFNLTGLPNVKEFYSCLDLPFLIYPGRSL